LRNKESEWQKFLNQINCPKDIQNYVLRILNAYNNFSYKIDSDLFHLSLDLRPATIQIYCKFLSYASTYSEIEIYNKSKKLNILNGPPDPYVSGENLISFGLTTGKDLGNLHKEIYDKQINCHFTSKEAAIEFAKKEISRRFEK
jgi:hypothetical protein